MLTKQVGLVFVDSKPLGQRRFNISARSEANQPLQYAEGIDGCTDIDDRRPQAQGARNTQIRDPDDPRHREAHPAHPSHCDQSQQCDRYHEAGVKDNFNLYLIHTAAVKFDGTECLLITMLNRNVPPFDWPVGYIRLSKFGCASCSPRPLPDGRHTRPLVCEVANAEVQKQSVLT